MSKTIFIIAGEASGDIIGAGLANQIHKLNPEIKFFGIGGVQMRKAGISSIFPMQEISLMGFVEIIPKFLNIYNRFHQLLDKIKEKKPEVLVTIDSPGFNLRLARKVKKILPGTKLIHIVAPSVWAYKEKRTKKFAKIFDHLLCLLPFEPEYFIKEGLKADFIGHPVLERCASYGLINFREKYNIGNEKLLMLMPGSRKQEVKRLLPLFSELAKKIKIKYPSMKIAVPVNENLKGMVQVMLQEQGINTVLVDNDIDKYSLMKEADLGIIKSGTSSLEAGYFGLPHIIAYKANFITAIIVKFLIKIDTVTIINILLKKKVIPEFIQKEAVVDKMIAPALDLLDKEDLCREQVSAMKEAINMLSLSESPAKKSAEIVLSYIE